MNHPVTITLTREQWETVVDALFCWADQQSEPEARKGLEQLAVDISNLGDEV